MDVRINEVQSQVQVGDSRSPLDPQVMREIIRACVKATREALERDKRLDSERRLNSESA